MWSEVFPAEWRVKDKDVALAVVAVLILRIVYLASRIERVLSQTGAGGLLAAGSFGRLPRSCADSAEGGLAHANGSRGGAAALPHIRGVLEAKDAISPRGVRRVTHARTEPPLPADLHRSATVGASAQPLGLASVSAHALDAAAGPYGLPRAVTLPDEHGATVSSIPPIRSSRHAHQFLSPPNSPKAGSEPWLRMQAELESVDVLPLATADETPLLVRMRIELSADLAEFPQHDDLSGDIRLLRFLRGYGHSVTQACAAYRAMLATRKQYDVERIRAQVLAQPLCAEEMPHGREIYPMYPIQLNCGVSRSGHLVSIDPLGALQLVPLIDELGPEKLFEFMIGTAELRQIIMDEMSATSGALVQSVQIKDLHGLSLAAFRDPRAMQTLQSILSTCTDMYPESLATLYIINAPFFFPVAWSIVSNFVSERTKKKIHVLGTDYAQTLAKDVGPQALEILAKLHAGELRSPGAAAAAGGGREAMRANGGSPQLRRREVSKALVASH